MQHPVKTFALCAAAAFAPTCVCAQPTGAGYVGSVVVLEGVPQIRVTKRADFFPTDILFWEKMGMEQRARLWSLMPLEQRLFQWRYMNRAERELMRNHMTPGERRAMKKSFVVQSQVPSDETRVNRTVKKMTPAERDLLRRQVIQVHVEISRGVPYNCADPTDCPRSAFRSRISSYDDPYFGRRRHLVVPSTVDAAALNKKTETSSR